MRTPLFTRHTFGLLGLGLATLMALPAGAAAQTPSATPAVALPTGPLGEQIGWFLDALNAAPPTTDDIAAHFAPEVLADYDSSEAQMVTIFLRLRQRLGTCAIEPDTLITTRNMPPTNARFILIGETGVRLHISLAVSPETELITAFAVDAVPEPGATPPA